MQKLITFNLLLASLVFGSSVYAATTVNTPPSGNSAVSTTTGPVNTTTAPVTTTTPSPATTPAATTPMNANSPNAPTNMSVPNSAPASSATPNPTTNQPMNTNQSFSNQSSSDSSITSNLQTQYSSDKTLTGQNITVRSDNGSVTLNGTVDNQAQADYATNLARSMNGVSNVKSNITVRSNTSTQ